MCRGKKRAVRDTDGEERAVSRAWGCVLEVTCCVRGAKLAEKLVEASRRDPRDLKQKRTYTGSPSVIFSLLPEAAPRLRTRSAFELPQLPFSNVPSLRHVDG